ncbi:MAG: hypothetical protein AAGJ32_06720 [Pseudomonadota bacterium]
MSESPRSDRPDHPAAKALFGWVEAKSTPNILLVGTIVIAIVLFAIDLRLERHEYLDFANSIFFYGIWGFLAFGLAVLSGWPLGRLLRRDEDYYGEAETQPADVENPDDVTEQAR